MGVGVCQVPKVFIPKNVITVYSQFNISVVLGSLPTYPGFQIAAITTLNSGLWCSAPLGSRWLRNVANWFCPNWKVLLLERLQYALSVPTPVFPHCVLHEAMCRGC